MKLIINILLSSVAIYLTALLVDQVIVTNYVTSLIAALVLGVINVTIKPVVKFLTLPLNILTLGILGFIINGVALYAVTYLVDGFDVVSFWWAVLAALLITFITTILSALLGSDE